MLGRAIDISMMAHLFAMRDGLRGVDMPFIGQ